MQQDPAFLNVELAKAVPICVIGNLVPIPFILLLLQRSLTGERNEAFEADGGEAGEEGNGVKVTR